MTVSSRRQAVSGLLVAVRPIVSVLAITLFAATLLALDLPWQKSEQPPAGTPPATANSMPAFDSRENRNWNEPLSSPKLDQVLRKNLESLGLNFNVNSNGTCRLNMKEKNDRSQLVFIAGTREEFLGAEFRKVWATAIKSAEAPPAETLQDLMRESAKKKIASWELQKWTDGYRVIIAAKIPVECSPKVLNAAIRLVGMVADDMEEKLTGKDEL